MKITYKIHSSCISLINIMISFCCKYFSQVRIICYMYALIHMFALMHYTKIHVTWKSFLYLFNYIFIF